MNVLRDMVRDLVSAFRCMGRDIASAGRDMAFDVRSVGVPPIPVEHLRSLVDREGRP